MARSAPKHRVSLDTIQLATIWVSPARGAQKAGRTALKRKCRARKGVLRCVLWEESAPSPRVSIYSSIPYLAVLDAHKVGEV